MPEICRRFCFASRAETNALIELKFRFELPNTPIKRMQKCCRHLKDLWVHNNISFHKLSCMPKLGRFHTCLQISRPQGKKGGEMARGSGST